MLYYFVELCSPAYVHDLLFIEWQAECDVMFNGILKYFRLLRKQRDRAGYGVDGNIRFIINLKDDEVECLEEPEDLDETELNAEMEGLIVAAGEFYDREMERYEKQ